MAVLFIFFRLLLAGVFILAGFTKLRDLTRTRQDFAGLGLPSRLIAPLSVGLPALEWAVGALLLFEPLVSWGAVLALGLLVIFTVVIGVNLWRGRRPACACFGALSRTHIGAGTLARNGGLMALAAVLLLPPASTPVGAIDLIQVSPAWVWLIAFASLGLVCLVAAWLGMQLWRQQGRLLLRIEQLEQRASAPAPLAPEPTHIPRPLNLVGQPAPALTLRDVAGRQMDLHTLRGRPTVLVFLDTSCQHCRALLAGLRTWSLAPHTAQLIVLLAEPPRRPIEFAPGITVVTDDVPSAMQAFGVLGTPTAITLDENGIVAEPAARGAAAVTQVLSRLTEQPQEVQHELAPV